ncbi:DNA double-strand break repair protein Rad50 [Candidatus Phytoplasma solani]|uniref:DNA double-strand break repair protein Rad50 n=1 Tax=Candidatus Phytoplasma solani TaxID=69896 RepID=UPI0032D9B775
MLSPLVLLKSYFTFKSYLIWFLLASAIFGIFIFFKPKYNQTKGIKKSQHKKPTSNSNSHTSWKGYLLIFLILITILGFIYFCFFYKPKEPSSKYVGQLIGEIDKAIDKYDQTINDYKALKSDWEGELKKCEKELKTLYEQKEINQEQKEKIKKLLEQTESKIPDIKAQKQETENNINTLKEQLKEQEQEKTKKDKEIAKKQEEEKLASPDDKIRLKAEISKLQDERLEIVKQIRQVEIKIGKLEIKQKSYESTLSNAIKLRDHLQRDYDNLSSFDKKLFAEITSAEERKAEIQKNIDEIDAKMITIGAERKQLGILRQAAEASKTALDDWDKKHEFSFGNLRDALFQGAELYLDACGGRAALKAIGGGITKKLAGTITKAGLIIHETHRVIKLAKDLFVNEDGTPKMMSKETYDSICARIERDKDKLDADYKDYEKKKEEYKNNQKSINLNNEIEAEKEQLSEFKNNDQRRKNRERTVIEEYQNIADELETKIKLISNPKELFTEQSDLEEKLEHLNVEIENTKEELKNKSPNYNRAQQRLKEKQKQKQHAKFFQPITNK